MRRLAALLLTLGVALLPARAAVAQDVAPVRLLGLSDAFDPALLDGFTRATGIPVLVDGVSTPDEVEAALRQPGAGPDLALVSAEGLGTRLRLDLLQPALGAAVVPETAAIDPRLMAALPGGAGGRAVPFDWFPLGFVVNAGKLKDAGLPADPSAGWDLLGRPELLRQALTCGLGVPDRPQALFALALAAVSSNRGAAGAERRRAFATLTQLRLEARKGTEAELADGLAQGDFCVAVLPAPAATLAIARAGQDASDLRFALPADGGPVTVEALGMPVAARNSGGALRLLRYLLRPDVSAANARWGHVAPAVGAAAEAARDGAALDRLAPQAADPVLERAVEAEWRRGAVR